MSYGWIFEKCFEIENEITQWRRTLHSLAEVRFETQKTQELIASKLGEMGLFARFVGGGVTCEISGTKGEGTLPFTNLDGKYSKKVTGEMKVFPNKEKCVLLRADIDALPLAEMTDLKFRAENGNMHACGHDIHAAALLGAAYVLQSNRGKFRGTVKLVFQSAEEILSGAKKMIAAGVLESPKVDFCAALHVVVGTEHEVGTVILPSGKMSAPYADFFKITAVGSGGHGAAPEESKNAALAGASIVVALDELSRSNGAESFSLSVCQISSGDAPNVIPESCEIFGTIRTLSLQARNAALEKMENICCRASHAHGCTSELEIISSTEALLCNENLAKSAEECLKSSYKSSPKEAKASVVRVPNIKIKASTPSEDFAAFAKRTPSVLVGLSAGKSSEGFSHPLHNPRVTFDERALPFGAAIYVTLAIGFLNNNGAQDVNQPR